MSRRASPDRRLARPVVFVVVVFFVVVFGAAVTFVSAAAAAPPVPPVPKGKRSPRKPPTHVVVRPTTLEALGVSVRLSPGVAVVVPGARTDGAIGGKVAVTLDGPVALGGRIEGSALGARLAHATPLADPSGGAIVGEGREGALLVVLGRAAAPGMVLCETVGAVRARVVVPSEVLTADPHELVLPVVDDPRAKMQAVASQAELLGSAGGRRRAHLAPGARVLVVGDARDVGKGDRGDGDGADRSGWARVRTYGAFALDGVMPRERLGSLADAPESAALSSKGLVPTHEVLTEAAASADGLGRKPIGTLRGGALVTVGIEVAGPRVRVMTHGDAVGEIWVPTAALRSLERDVWNERD